MKWILSLSLILTFSFVAFADDYPANEEAGRNEGGTEASFNDSTKAHQAAQKSYGKSDSAFCPNCAKQNAIFEQPDDGDPAAVKAGGSDTTNGNSSSQKGRK